MGQEFTINSQTIEDKLNSILPSQGGYGAGIDFSASTMIIPVVDITEAATGAGLRQDLQTSLNLTNVTSFNILPSTNATMVNTTGYWRIFGISALGDFAGAYEVKMELTDGTTTKIIYNMASSATAINEGVDHLPFDFIVYLKAGESLTGTAGVHSRLTGATRQIATIDGTLVTT